MEIKENIIKAQEFLNKLRYGTEEKHKMKRKKGVNYECYISKDGKLTTLEKKHSGGAFMKRESKSTAIAITSDNKELQNNENSLVEILSTDKVTKKVYDGFKIAVNEVDNKEVTEVYKTKDGIYNKKQYIYSRDNILLTTIETVYKDENNTSITTNHYSYKGNKRYVAIEERVEENHNFNEKGIEGFSINEEVNMKRTIDDIYYSSDGSIQKEEKNIAVYGKRSLKNEEKTYGLTTIREYDKNHKVINEEVSREVRWNGINGRFKKINKQVILATGCDALTMEPEDEIGELRIKPQQTVAEMVEMVSSEKINIKEGTIRIEVAGYENNRYFGSDGVKCRIMPYGKTKDEALNKVDVNQIKKTLGEGYSITDDTYVEWISPNFGNVGSINCARYHGTNVGNLDMYKQNNNKINNNKINNNIKLLKEETNYERVKE